MILTVQIRDKVRHLNSWALILLAVYAAILLTALRTFILWQSINFLVGVVALFSATVIKKADKTSVRYACLAMLLACLCLAIPVKTMLFFGVAFGVFSLIETFQGRMNILPVFILFMMSPVFQFFTNIFSFELRLQLTKWAGSLLNFVGMDCVVEGNIIMSKGIAFAVDPACMGLNMTITSLLCGIIMVSAYQKKYLRTLNIGFVGLILTGILFLNIVSNLARIVCLVQFEIMPATLIHDLVGIVCLLVYVILPSMALIKRIVLRCGKSLLSPGGSPVASGVSLVHWFMNIVTATAIAVAAYGVTVHDGKSRDTSKEVPQLDGFKTSRISSDIVKLENETSLIYIKAIPAFYSADHNPMICWRGSGYIFSQVKKVHWNRSELYTAALKNNKDVLYTAWWYQGSGQRTINQFEWRWDALRNGNSYSVINVTAASEELLKEEIIRIQSLNLLVPFLESGQPSYGEVKDERDISCPFVKFKAIQII